MQDVDRQKILDGYQILDSGYEAGFDRITELARTIFEAPAAVICFLDKDRQWFKSHPGFEPRQTPIEHAICRFTVLSDEALLIPDAMADERTRDNPYVTGPDHLRAYAGAPLIAPGGVRIGTVSIFDRKPRNFGPRDEAILQQLAAIVMHNLELRRVADKDWLTGAAGRGAFERRSRALLSGENGDGQQNALIVFDLDFFKKLNDTYGHAAGDKVLKEVSRICQSSLREDDVFRASAARNFPSCCPAHPGCGRKGGAAPAAVHCHTAPRPAVEIPAGDGQHHRQLWRDRGERRRVQHQACSQARRCRPLCSQGARAQLRCLFVGSGYGRAVLPQVSVTCPV
ncbi:sensor domain-containing diguanylate cyclase [Pannonibacter phragmitetus]|uniref:sensor domain-containing diguanylate cyclase n=1 Tax=Pannonibacter phragmitetus TaxID=121719 RepID=UPI003D2F0260